MAAVIAVLLGVIGALAAAGSGHATAQSSAAPNSATAVSAPNSPSTPSGYSTFTSKADKFSIAVPSTWKKVDPSSPGAQAAINEIERLNPGLGSALGTSAVNLAERGMLLLAVDPAAAPDGFTSSMNVVAKPDLVYSASSLTQLEAQLPGEYAKVGATITGSTIVTFDHRKALRATSSWLVNTPSGRQANIQQTQYFLGANGLLFVLTLSGTNPALPTIASTFSTGG